MKQLLNIISLLLLISLGFPQAYAQSEASYRDAWCVNGITEVRLKDGTRADCVTASHAVELDFTGKWAEGIMQAAHYGRNLKLRPALLLVQKASTSDAEAMKHYNTALANIEFYNLPVVICLMATDGTVKAETGNCEWCSKP